MLVQKRKTREKTSQNGLNSLCLNVYTFGIIDYSSQLIHNSVVR